MKTSSLLPVASFIALFTAACGPSLGSMHARATTGNVQSDAPLHAHQSVTIAAPRARIYAILSDFGSWPTWQPSVKQVTPPPAVEPGAQFTWVNGSSEIHSKLAVVQPNEQLGWTGSVSTAKAIHMWRLSSPTPETTVVDCEETMDGFLLTWFYGQKDLDADMARSLEELRSASEGRPVR